MKRQASRAVPIEIPGAGTPPDNMEPKTFALWLGGGWPPSSDKRMGQSRRTGFRFRTAEYKEFLALVADAVQAFDGPRFGRTWLDCDLYFVRPDRVRRDASNTHKTLLDSLQEAGVYEDDLRVNPLQHGVRDVGDTIAHPMVPHDDSGRAIEGGVLVLLRPAGEMSRPARDS